jgi:putative tryptophan/tyrosine transport system substrate-binding protein
VRRRALIVGGASLVLLRAHAAAAAETPRIGLVLAGQERRSPPGEAFDARMRELGYIDGGNVAILFRSAEGHADRLPGIMSELVAQLPAAIVAVGPEATVRAAHTATAEIPIVMVAIDYDPLARGYVKSLARPGGNITGIFAEQIDLTVKRLELLAQIVPGARRVGVLSDQFSADQARAAAEAAPRLGLSVETIEFKNPPYEFAPAAANLRESGAGAVLALMSPVFYRQRAALADSLLRAGLPASFGLREWPEAGGLMSYGANIGGMMRKAADYADKVLKGAKPADLPVQQPTKFELVINLKTANALGLAVPPSLLARADEVIE